MSHRATVYTIAIRPRNKRKPEPRYFGNYDESGTWLGDTLVDLLTGLDHTRKDGERSARCVSVATVGDEIHAVVHHGASGFAADIVDPTGAPKARQETVDTSWVECAMIFRLPRDEHSGYWAIHVNSGRSPKELIHAGLRDRLASRHEDLTLRVASAVNTDAYREAVNRGRVGEIKLTKLVRPADRAVEATEKWVRDGKEAKMELRLTGARAAFLNSKLIKQFMNGDRSVGPEILEFQDIEFDRATVGVELDDGAKRSFNIERPDSGYAFSCNLEGLTLNNGEPTPESLHAALGRVVDDMSS